MDSTFLGIEIGKRSLLTHRKALNVVSHNLSNSNNETYSRQRIIFETVDPLYRPQLNRLERPGQIGQGVDVGIIRRERDIHLDGRIYNKEGSLAFWKKNLENLKEIEVTYNALGETNLQDRMDRFWSDWQDLSLNPSEPANQVKLVESAKLLTGDIRTKYQYFNDLRQEIDQKIVFEVSQINTLIDKIAQLNGEILAARTMGDNPNDLLDKRDGFVEELSQFIDVEVSFRDNDEMMVFTEGNIIVQGSRINRFLTESDPQNEGLTRVYWEWTGDTINPQAGSLRANIIARDEHLTTAINQLDVISNNLIYAVNEIHREGFNSYGRKTGDFFKVHFPGDSALGNFDTNADGVQENTLIYEIKGATKLDPKQPIGADGTITLRRLNENGTLEDIAIDYVADEKIGDLIERLNLSEDSLNFYLDFNGKLSIKSRSNTPDYPFAIPYLSDSGEFLTGISGVLQTPDVAFDSGVINSTTVLNENATFNRTPLKHAAAWIDVVDFIKEDSNLIATRSGVNYDGENGFDSAYGREEGGIARAIARLRHNNTLFDETRTFNEYYSQSVIDIASKIKNADSEVIRYEALLDHLENVRQSISGVNIDEEMSNMIAFQQGYEAGARIVRIMDELLDTLINRT